MEKLNDTKTFPFQVLIIWGKLQNNKPQVAFAATLLRQKHLFSDLNGCHPTWPGVTGGKFSKNICMSMSTIALVIPISTSVCTKMSGYVGNFWMKSK